MNSFVFADQATLERSVPLSSTEMSVAHRASRLVGRPLTLARDWLQSRRDIAALNDRLLVDIGLSRADLDALSL